MDNTKNDNTTSNFFNHDVMGIPMSRGITTGNILFAKDSHTSSDFKDKIVIVQTLRIDQITSLATCKGVITETGGKLSHTAIITRELGIPCVGGITNTQDIFTDGDVVLVDGNIGIIKVKELPNKNTNIQTSYELNHYNPKYIKKIKIGRETVLYSTNKNITTVYLQKIGNSRENLDIKSKFSEELKIHPDSILISTIGVWEGSNSPSIVYTQHKDLSEIENDNQLNKLLKIGVDLINSLQIKELEVHLRNINKQAHKNFIIGYKSWQTFKETNKPEHADRAAKLFEEARVLSTILVGNVLIEIYGTSYIENEVTKLNTFSVEEIFNKTASTKNPKISKLIELAEVLEKIRNENAQILSVNNISFYEIINDFYMHNQSRLVEKYNW